MLLDALMLAVVAAGFWVARRTCSSRVAFVLMPRDDQPPPSCDDPWPPARHLARYVDRGLGDIDAFLAGQDSAT